MNDIIKDKLRAMSARRTELEKAARFAHGQRNSLVYALGKLQLQVADLEAQIERVDAQGEKIVAELREMNGAIKFIKEVTATDRQREEAHVSAAEEEPEQQMREHDVQSVGFAPQAKDPSVDEAENEN